MGNPLFNIFGAPQRQNIPGPFGNMMNVVSQFNAFRNNFQGNPQEKVQELLNSGQMSQQQFQQLSAMVQPFQQLLGKK